MLQSHICVYFKTRNRFEKPSDLNRKPHPDTSHSVTCYYLEKLLLLSYEEENYTRAALGNDGMILPNLIGNQRTESES